MTGLANAVRLTQKYASFFKSRLTDEELHRWLITDKPCSPNLLKKRFPQKLNTVSSKNHSKLNLARRVSLFLSRIPTIKLVAATGSLAINNAKIHDDIDLMIITSNDTLWLTRLFVVPLISLFFKRRLPHTPGVCEVDSPGVCFTDTICLNLWLDESALSVPIKKRNLYTAHEVLQALPLFDRGNTYAKFIRANSWTSKYLANAYNFARQKQFQSASPARPDPEDPILQKGQFLQGKLSSLKLISFLNNLSFRLQYLYMKPKITNETVNLHSAYFHPRTLALDLEKYLNQK